MAVAAVPDSPTEPTAGAESDAPEAAPRTGQPAARHSQSAGHHHSVRNSIEMTVSRLARELDLTADQQARLTHILIGERQQLHEAATGGPPQADRVGRVKDILDRTREKIRDILTVEQRKKYPGVTPSDLLGPAHADVEGWIRATQGKSPPPTGNAKP